MCRVLTCVAFLGWTAAWSATPQTVEFNRDIRPILSDRCYACHGPDAAKRISKLRLDVESSAKADLGGHFAIVPGNSPASELIRRVSSDDKARRMPPVWSGAAKLSAREIDLLTRWIAAGCEMAEALVVHPAGTAGGSGRQRSALAEEPHRCVRAGTAGCRRAEAVRRGRPADPGSPRDARPDRTAANPG